MTRGDGPTTTGTAAWCIFFGPFLYRSAFHSDNEQQECERALEHLERTVALEGPSTIAAIILESVPGTAGIMVPPPGYLAGVREICDRHGIVFIIADEVMAGFGRTGKWFAINNFDVVPDLITFAKGVTSGYVPLGGVAINDAIYRTFADRAYPGGLTYSGHPLATGCAVATINRWKTREWSPMPPASVSRCSAPVCVTSPPGTRRRRGPRRVFGPSNWSPIR